MSIPKFFAPKIPTAASEHDKLATGAEAAAAKTGAQIAAILARKPPVGDAPGRIVWDETEAPKMVKLRRELGRHREAAKFHRIQRDEAVEQAARQHAIDDNAARQRDAEASKKRVRAIQTSIEKLRDDLIWLKGHVDDVELYNRNERGNLPYVVDAETLLRTIPGRTIPPTYRDEVKWVMGDREAYTFKNDPVTGELVPVEQGYTRKVITVRQTDERFEHARMPPRLCDEIKLVGLDGKPVWPA